MPAFLDGTGVTTNSESFIVVAKSPVAVASSSMAAGAFTSVDLQLEACTRVCGMSLYMLALLST
jgi:hypothetical protein